MSADPRNGDELSPERSQGESDSNGEITAKDFEFFSDQKSEPAGASPEYYGTDSQHTQGDSGQSQAGPLTPQTEEIERLIITTVAQAAGRTEPSSSAPVMSSTITAATGEGDSHETSSTPRGKKEAGKQETRVKKPANATEREADGDTSESPQGNANGNKKRGRPPKAKANPTNGKDENNEENKQTEGNDKAQEENDNTNEKKGGRVKRACNLCRVSVSYPLLMPVSSIQPLFS